jgi:predicted Fe-Mo cluster-binding NifX family protein
MKIAIVTEDEVTISQHFGRAPYYAVYTVEDGKVTGKEIRDKAGHHTFAAHHTETAPGQKHGYDAGAQTRHTAMAETISDCQVLIAGGMGMGAFESMRSRGIEVIATDEENVETAVSRYIEGNLPNLMERTH